MKPVVLAGGTATRSDKPIAVFHNIAGGANLVWNKAHHAQCHASLARIAGER